MKKNCLLILPLISALFITNNKFAEKHINNSNESGAAFASFYAHEIKNCLNAVLGLISMLEKTPLDDHQKTLMRKIDFASDTLTDLLNEFIGSSKGQKSSEEKKSFPLSHFFRYVVSTYTYLCDKKGIAFKSDIDIDDNVYIYASKLHLFQILSNLLGNALKFTEEGSIELTVKTAYEDEQHIKLDFSVVDTGPGIPNQTIEHVFQKYFHVDSQDSHGFGIGLYLCESLIKSMGGNLSVSSTYGNGACFSFSLLFEKTQLESMSILDSKIPHRVLVIDDDQLTCEIVSDYLSEVGYECDSCESGEEALDRFENLSKDYYDLILTDICMAGLSGIDTAKILKEKIGVTSPILAVTGSEYSSPYIDGAVLKPFNKTGLVTYVNKFLASSAGKKAAIDNLNGREDLYEKYLNRFKKNYSDAPEKIRAYLAKNEFDEAYRLAHSMKGLAGTLGLMDIHETSATLSDAIQSQSPDCISFLQTFEEEMHKLLHQ